jgi:hypothetical protein
VPDSHWSLLVQALPVGSLATHVPFGPELAQ